MMGRHPTLISSFHLCTPHTHTHTHTLRERQGEINTQKETETRERKTERHLQREKETGTDTHKERRNFYNSEITASQINMGSPKSVDLPIVSFSPE